MLCHVLFEGQGWSPDHPDQLPLPFIMARASKLSRAEPVMVCVMNETLSKFIWRKRKKKQEWSLRQSLLWPQVSQLTFIYLLRLAITPYCP